MEDAIFTYVGSLGFPIVACVGLFYLYDKTIKQLTVTLEKINLALEQLTNEFTAHREKMEDDKSA